LAENSPLDPSTIGFFIVAALSLPLAIANLVQDSFGSEPIANLFIVSGLGLIVVAHYAWKCNANFGFTVFGLVGIAVLLTGMGALGPIGNITFAIVFIFAIIWSVIIGAAKNLTALLVTTALIFLFVGLSNSAVIGGDYWHWLIGAAAILNFAFNFSMAVSCAIPEKYKGF